MIAQFTSTNGNTLELWVDNSRDAYIRVCRNNEEIIFTKIGDIFWGVTEIIPWNEIPTDLLIFMTKVRAILDTMRQMKFDPYFGICDIPSEYRKGYSNNKNLGFSTYLRPLNRKARRAIARDSKGRFIKVR